MKFSRKLAYTDEVKKPVKEVQPQTKEVPEKEGNSIDNTTLWLLLGAVILIAIVLLKNMNDD